MNTRPNNDIRDMLKCCKVTQYELSKALGIGETTLYRRLRDELQEDQKEIYIEAIKKLASKD